MNMAQHPYAIPSVAVGTGIGALAGLGLLVWRLRKNRHRRGQAIYSALRKGAAKALHGITERLERA
jgi:hypothetical protein